MVSGNISGGDVEEYVVIDESDVSKIASDEDSVAIKNTFSKLATSDRVEHEVKPFYCISVSVFNTKFTESITAVNYLFYTIEKATKN